MPKKTIDQFKTDILGTLEKAGPRGSTKSGLGVKSKTPKETAFRELIKTGDVANLGTRTRPKWVLKKHYLPLETASAHIVEKAKKSNDHALVEGNLKKELRGPVLAEASEAVKQLTRDGILVGMRISGRTYYALADRLKSLLPAETFPEAGLPGRDAPSTRPGDIRDRVKAAYEKVKESFGFSDVRISEVQEESGLPMDLLKEFLLEESRAGRAEFGVGDWSLSPEDVRAGAVLIRGKPHMLIRIR